MQFEQARPFLEANHRGVLTTFRRSGATQMSILLCGPYRGTVAFVIQDSTAMLANLRRDPQCSVLAVTSDWSGYIVAGGEASIHDWGNTDPEQLRIMLREVFLASGGHHDNWEEYDRVVMAEQRAVVMVRADNLVESQEVA